VPVPLAVLVTLPSTVVVSTLVPIPIAVPYVVTYSFPLSSVVVVVTAEDVRLVDVIVLVSPGLCCVTDVEDDVGKPSGVSALPRTPP
jgi:hypothetical protein